jgi:twitching motility protein PilJ
VIKTVLERFTIAVLIAAMLAGAAYFCIRLYSTPLEQRFLSLTGELRVLARGLRDNMKNVTESHFSSMAVVQNDDARISEIVEQLRQIYASGGSLVALVVPVGEVDELASRWDEMRQRLGKLLADRAVLKDVDRSFDTLDEVTRSISVHAQTIVQILLDKGASSREITLASRQLMLAVQINSHLHAILRPAARGISFTKTEDYSAVVKDASLFERTLEAMLNGDATIGIPRVTGTEAARELRMTGDLYRTMSAEVGKILAAAPVLLNTRRTATDLLAASGDFEQDVNRLSNNVIDFQSDHDVTFIAVYLLGAVAVFVLFLYGLAVSRTFKSQLEFSTVQGMRYKDVISRMREALMRLARGEVGSSELDMRDGMEGVITPFNQATGRVRETLKVVKTSTVELPPLIERIKSATGRMVQAGNRQVEGTTAASGTLNRLLPTMEDLSRQVSDALRALDALKSDVAAGRGLVREAALAMERPEGPVAAPLTGSAQERVAFLIDQVGELSRGVEQLSVMVLHLIIKAHGVGQQDHEPVPYANNALQIAHRCTEAADRLSEGLTELRGDSGQHFGADRHIDEGLMAQARLTEDADNKLSLVDATIDQINAVLRDIPGLLNEQGTAILSASDDMDKIHEYTMQLSNGTAEISRAIKHIADTVDQIRRDVDGYNILQ